MKHEGKTIQEDEQIDSSAQTGRIPPRRHLSALAEESTDELIFQFLIAYKRDNDGNTPSTREIAAGCSVSLSTTQYHLTQLQLKQRIRIVSQRPRQIEIVGGIWCFPEDPRGSQNSRDDTPVPSS